MYIHIYTYIRTAYVEMTITVATPTFRLGNTYAHILTHTHYHTHSLAHLTFLAFRGGVYIYDSY